MYILKNFNELPSYRTAENFEMPQFELDGFVNVDSKEMAQEWFKAFESHSKTTMPQTKDYNVKGNRVLFREKRHCAHKRWRLELDHPLEINIKFIHNYIIDSAESLSFRRVNDDLHQEIEMFNRLKELVNEYNNSGNGKAVLQEYDMYTGKAFILCIYLISDESEVTLEKALNLLKTILSPYVFYGRGPQIGPAVILTDDSSAERNALELC
ncbi:23362_t:CDS:2 [Gigaspora margarita]|uniref:23362_t:CDS:1 n=1 Tax=Gigaspora margarita TaxID=4874 RepID=A0ABN7UES2_GIGMA|nr:23362_t:CDS:2 [Gigaspora margarita]